MQPETAGSDQNKNKSKREVLRYDMHISHKGHSLARQMSIMQECCSRATQEVVIVSEMPYL